MAQMHSPMSDTHYAGGMCSMTPPLYQGSQRQAPSYIHHNGMITPVSSPVKSAFAAAEHGHNHYLFPGTVDPSKMAQLMTPPPETPKKVSKPGTSRQTTIPAHLKAKKPTKPKGSAPRGRPRKNPKPATTLADTTTEKLQDEQIKAELAGRIETYGFQPRKELIDQLYAVPGSSTMDAYELCSLYESLQAQPAKAPAAQVHTPPSHVAFKKGPTLKRKAGSTPSSASVETPPLSKSLKIHSDSTPCQAVRVPPTPVSPLNQVAQRQDAYRSPSPDLSASSPELCSLGLFIDASTGQAVINASYSSESSLPSLSTGSTTSSGSSMASFSASFADLTLPHHSADRRRVVTKANVPGMGRVLFERSVLISRLGDEGAQKAIASAEAATFHRSTIFDATHLKTPDDASRPPLLAGRQRLPSACSDMSTLRAMQSAAAKSPRMHDDVQRNKEELVNRWLESEWDQEDDMMTMRTRATHVSGGKMHSDSFFHPNASQSFHRVAVEDDFVLSQGGKSVRVLKRRNDLLPAFGEGLEDMSRDALPTSRPFSRHSRSSNDGQVACVCGRGESEEGDSMVQCDACCGWLHLECLGIASIHDLPETGDWFCFRCTNGPFPALSHRRQLSYGESATRLQEPVLVQSSPQLGKPNGFSLDAPLALHTSSPSLNDLATPGSPSKHGHSKSSRSVKMSHAWDAPTPSMSHSQLSFHTFSPRTPAVGVMRGNKFRSASSASSVHFDDVFDDDVSGMAYASHLDWHQIGLQTPSRSAGLGLQSDWSFPTPGMAKRKLSFGHSHVQDFFHGLQQPHGTPKHHVTFETFTQGSPPVRATPKHRRMASLSSPRLEGSLRHGAMKQQHFQPSSMARSGSGLGIGLGFGNDTVGLDDLMGL